MELRFSQPVARKGERVRRIILIIRIFEDLLKKLQQNGVNEVLFAQLFLNTLRKNAKNRDLAKICQGFGTQSSKLRIHRLARLGNHTLMIDILGERISRDR